MSNGEFRMSNNEFDVWPSNPKLIPSERKISLRHSTFEPRHFLPALLLLPLFSIFPFQNPILTTFPLIPYFVSALGGYVLGSIPLGYLLVKYRARVDIRTSGSGNVGAYNAGVVTGSTFVGIAVGILDGSKGLAAVMAAWFVFGSFWPAAIALLGSVVGHIAPVWLRWKGGRGLATACGGFFAIGLGFTIVWCTLWAVCKWQRLSILTSNVIATIATPVILVLLPSQYIGMMMISETTPAEFRTLAFSLTAVLLLSHRDALKGLREERTS
jgi:glycerol-3-phosphate acyltransferase PlsY